jgi:Leucine-rich repeat (LRR) protein
MHILFSSVTVKINSLTRSFISFKWTIDIHGQIPEDIANLSNLKYLDIGGCKLTGPLPLDMWHSMRMLKTLSLNGNAISGTIPDSISKLESLQSLWMQDNKLCGSIPPMGALDELRAVDLSNNGGEINM